jgi:hypothetical protein
MHRNEGSGEATTGEMRRKSMEEDMMVMQFNTMPISNELIMIMMLQL